MRRKIVAGNWKMHGTVSEITTLLETIKPAVQALKGIDVIVFPSAVHLSLVRDLLQNTTIFWGAQNFYPGKAGAFTGEVSAHMIKEYGCRYVLVGHSERRQLFLEDLKTIADKFKGAVDAGLVPILCIGETLQEREQNRTEAVISQQLESVIAEVGIKTFHQAIIAYEPVWAIGTGLTATPDQAESVHAFIRTILTKQDLEVGNTMRILYGGSVKAENAAGLFAMPNIDGGLVGGASLIAKDFIAICQAAVKEGLMA